MDISTVLLIVLGVMVLCGILAFIIVAGLSGITQSEQHDDNKHTTV